MLPCQSLARQYDDAVQARRFAISSLGFELQSSDLFTVLIDSNVARNRYECRYATEDDIPENQPVPLFEGTPERIGVQLDAVPLVGEGEVLFHVNKIEPVHAQNVLGDTSMAMLESDSPQDTEFVSLITDAGTVRYFEPEGKTDPVELMLTQYEYLRSLIFDFRLPDRYQAIAYQTPFPSLTKPTKFNLLIFPKSLKFGAAKQVGFMMHALDAADLGRVSVVPQVTFGCALNQSYLILHSLAARTAENECMPPLRRAMAFVERSFGKKFGEAVFGNELGFLFLLSYYVHVMAASSKQKLGIALRHEFMAVFESLSNQEKANLEQATDGCIVPMLHYASALQVDDGIHKYPYTDTGRILIEYRLFSYAISKGGCDSVQISPKLKRFSVQFDELSDDEPEDTGLP